MNVLYFSLDPFKRRPFPIKTRVIWVAGICEFMHLSNPIKENIYLVVLILKG